MTDAPQRGPLLKTPLHAKHLALGAKMVDFGGWHMPVNYPPGILEEHRTVRSAAGLFDVSHMGEARLRGPRALEVVQRLCTNDIAKAADGTAMYTVMCNEQGGIVDDCIVYRVSAENFLIVLNASNVEKDVAHIRSVAGTDCEVGDESGMTALIAVQGPLALEICNSALRVDAPYQPNEIKKNQHVTGTALGKIPVRIAATGYTGEDGVEIFCTAEEAGDLWDGLLAADARLKPIGLGARDTQRLEAKLCLYGNDIDEATTPLEAGLGWVVKLDKGDFVGRAALAKQKADGLKKQLVGFVMKGRGIARHGYPVHAPGASPGDAAPGPVIGVVTSGTTGPTVGVAIGMAYVPPASAAPGSQIVVDCRGKHVPAEVVKGAFYTKGKGAGK